MAIAAISGLTLLPVLTWIDGLPANFGFAMAVLIVKAGVILLCCATAYGLRRLINYLHARQSPGSPLLTGWRL